MEVRDVIIIGSGPAGLTAALYCARADLKPLVLGGVKWGGQLMLTTEVENFPGFVDGIQGPDLMQNFRKQAERFGSDVKDVDVTGVDFGKAPFTVSAGGQEFMARSVIIATGAETNWLNLPSEQRLIGHGVSSCAPCDAFFFRGKAVIVVGGGDSAMEEALFLTKFATSVTIVHRREEFRASKIMLERAQKNERIKFIKNSQIVEVLGKEKVEGVRLKDTVSSDERELAIDGIFVAIGHSPMAKIFEGQIDLDERGYIKRMTSDEGLTTNVGNFKTMTSVDGVFVAGDVHDYHYRQAVTAAGYGCQAALEVERWLEDKS